MKIPHSPPLLDNLMRGLCDPEKLFEIMSKVSGPMVDGRYLHWDEVRHRTPPLGLTHEEWWMGLRYTRRMSAKFLPLKDTKGNYFSFSVPDLVSDLLHQIDRGGGTIVSLPEQVTSPEQRDRYVVRSLIEEAITSSQLEGAVTTREVAKKMLREDRRPSNRSERMIVNNFKTMGHILNLKDQPLTKELVFDIHRELSEGTLDIQDGAGRFRRKNEDINVSDIDGTVFHKPPPSDELESRMEAMCDFANGKTTEGFLHPVIRAIILHFWLAYDHPFVDGNGRTARALFYRQMLHSDYWMFEFISISQFLRKAPTRYAMAFLHSETDENDLTYFLIHQIEVIKRALKELHDYVARKSSETRACILALQRFPELNHRQQTVIAHAIRHPGFAYTIAGHGKSHKVVYQTARTDLLQLAELGLLDQGKAGRALVFYSPKDLELRLQSR